MQAHLMRCIGESLEAEAKEVMNSLGIPEYLPIPGENGYITQDSLLAREVHPFYVKSKPKQAWHGIRVAIYDAEISRILGFSPEAARLKWATDLAHDRGKLAEVFDGFDKDKAHPRYSTCIHIHVLPENIAAEYGPLAQAAIERHHLHQKKYSKPYPHNLRFPETPEGFLLSQLIAIPDFYDSALTTGKTTETIPEQGYREEHYLTPGQAVESVLGEYGDMILRCSAGFLPAVDVSGREIILEMVRRGLFGKVNFKENSLPEKEKVEFNRYNPFAK